MRVQGSDIKTINLSSDAAAKAKEAERKNNKKGSGDFIIKAEELNLGAESIEEKRRKAQKMALGLVSNAFNRDKEIDDDLEARRKNIDALRDEKAEYRKMIKNIDETEKKMAEEYGVDPDSEEQADLELLKKERRALRDPMSVSLTDEERERLGKIKENGLTDYQNDALILDEGREEFEKRIDKIDSKIKEENQTIAGIENERLKSHDMVDAVKQGDKIMEAASKEIISMLMEDAKDKTDEKIEEEKEKGEAEKEKAEELQEKIDEAKAKRDEERERLEEMYEISAASDEAIAKAAKGTDTSDMKKSLESIVNELKLTLQDLSGAVVDNKV